MLYRSLKSALGLGGYLGVWGLGVEGGQSCVELRVRGLQILAWD